jgi:DNA repair exonuclease SbcCD ATPase subunit
MSKYRRKDEVEDNTSYSEELEAQVAADSEPKEPEEASFKKRYGDLRRHTQQLMSQKDQELDKLKAQLDSAAKGQIKFPKTDEEIEDWTKKYPDVSKIVNTIAQKHANKALEEGEKRLGHLKDLETKLTKKEAEQQLMKLHPDFSEIRQDPAFHDWVAMQPQNMQDALYKNNTDAMAASRAIDLYKADTGKRKTTSKRSAAQAVGRTSSSAPAATGKAKFSESQIARMSDREYDANEEAILLAMRTEGGFIYDMSGGAR